MRSCSASTDAARPLHCAMRVATRLLGSARLNFSALSSGEATKDYRPEADARPSGGLSAGDAAVALIAYARSTIAVISGPLR